MNLSVLPSDADALCNEDNRQTDKEIRHEFYWGGLGTHLNLAKIRITIMPRELIPTHRRQVCHLSHPSVHVLNSYSAEVLEGILGDRDGSGLLLSFLP